jgi:isoleucyl-tRNA synthetase
MSQQLCISNDVDYTSYTKLILEQWKDKDLENYSDGKDIFRFMDGPPFVTGKLHLGHVAIGAIKSTFLNYKRMMGYSCLNKLGYDCHGLPIESYVNKFLNISSLDDLQSVGMEKFNQTCKDKIREFEGSWKPIYKKIGRWTDFDTTYKTMDVNFMESVWWAFKSLSDKGLTYYGFKITPYSYPLQSPLSNFEAQQNYKDVDTKSIYVKFKLLNTENTYFVAWTTTPWTLISNIALCVNPDLDYDYVLAEDNNIYILASGTLNNASIKMIKIIKTVKGSELVNIEYTPPYNFMKRDIFKVVADNYVTKCTNHGTSIVHIAPAFGEDDYNVCIKNNIVKKYEIGELCPIDENCKYLKCIDLYANRLVFDCNDDIIKCLKQQNLICRIQSYRHSYPFCYRTNTPLIYRCVKSFYINVESIKERMIQLNDTINWIPFNIGDNRFKKWLEGARDWCVSRSRYFGTPIPVWMNNNGDSIVIGSIDELKKLANINVITDLHPEIINNITFVKDGSEYKRIPDIFDCWFESGCVPYGQIHYPFENKNYFDNLDYLSDFVVEGIDQTRGWFYTLLVLSTALLDKAPFKNVICTGLVRDESGLKMSKSNNNYVDTEELIDNYGADVIRIYLLLSGLSNGEDLKFKTSDITEIKQKVIQLINSVKFYIEHFTNMKINNVDSFNSLKDCDISNLNFMDTWIISSVVQLKHMMIDYMDNFNVSKYVKLSIDFIEDLTNYYIKFNRDRLKGKFGNDEWKISMSVLHYVFTEYCYIIAPVAPFLSEYIYQEINKSDETSIHFIKFIHDDFIKDYNVLNCFDLLKRIAKLVRSARSSTKTHTSQKTPILKCEICINDDKKIENVSKFIDNIQDELNCINIIYGKLSDEVEYSIKPNLRNIGLKYKKEINEIKKYLTTVNVKDIVDNNVHDIKFNNIVLTNDDYEIIISPKQNTKSAKNIYTVIDSDILIKIDFTYDEIVEMNHQLKCISSYVQQTRKYLKLKLWNKINVKFIFDSQNIISNNIEHLKTRLDCIVSYDPDYDGSDFYEVFTYNNSDYIVKFVIILIK